MIYIKSTLAGIVALVLATIVYVIYAANAVLRRYPPPPNTHVSINIVALLNRPSNWLIALAAFALGFYWEWRRLS